jgi:hypothetical protein
MIAAGRVDGTHTCLGRCNVAECHPFGGEPGCGRQTPWWNLADGTASASRSHRRSGA